MDVGTGLAILGSAELTVKLLGPTAEYIGEGTRDLVEKQVNKAREIFSNAVRKAGGAINENRVVSPRVLRRVLQDGTLCEDAIAVEYFGGLLASSRSHDVRDDTALPLVNIVSQLSTSQIRLHFIIYRNLSAKAVELTPSTPEKHYTPGVGVWFERAYLISQMGISSSDSHRLAQAVAGLENNGLIERESEYLAGDLRSDRFQVKDLQGRGEDAGVIIRPTQTGVDLFLGAHGRKGVVMEEFIHDGASVTSSVSVEFTPATRSCFVARRTQGGRPRLGIIS
jgi:hypothetical protein